MHEIPTKLSTMVLLSLSQSLKYNLQMLMDLPNLRVHKDVIIKDYITGI